MKRITGLLVASGLLAAAAPAMAQSTIRPGETVRGSLGASDRSLDDGSFYDCFNLQAQAGQSLSITLRSDDFDAYLSLHQGGSCDSEIQSDDDGLGDGSDSRLEHTFGRGGRYSLRANSLSSGETGRYALVVEIE